MLAYRPTAPLSLTPGKQARRAAYKADTLADWIAEVDVLPEGATEITAEQYVALLGEIEAHNEAIPPPPEPEPQPDPFALIAEKLDEYAGLLRSDNRKNEADKMHEVAEVARAASGR
jgi:hypothetical protein